MTFEKPKFFKIEELVSPVVYKKFGYRSWMFIDPRLCEVLDFLREIFGPMIMNTWHSKRLQKKYGLRRWAGFREPGCDVGAEYSQHRFGRGGDPIPVELSAKEVRDIIREDKALYDMISRIENNVSWLHVDVPMVFTETPQFFNP